MTVLAVSYSGFVSNFELDSSFLSSEAVIVRIGGVCLGLGESYGISLGGGFQCIQEFVILKMCNSFKK